jgi:hypothetical protein
MRLNRSLAESGARILGVISLGLFLLGWSGCVLTEGARTSAATYGRGELEANLGNDYERVVEASRGALSDLEFARASENGDALKAVLISRTPLDKKVEIMIANSGKSLTNIKIRVGSFGDEQVSRAILDKIKARL